MPFIFYFLCIFISTNASAAAGLCDWLRPRDRLNNLVTKRVSLKTPLTVQERKLVMHYVAYHDDGPGPYSHFSNFEELMRYIVVNDEEFYLQQLRVPAMSNSIFYVWSYPGDTEYGLYLTVNGEVMAEIQDGQLRVGGQWCP